MAGNEQSLKMYPESYVVLDIETTGLSAQKDSIIELSALRVDDNKVVDEFSELVNPECYVSPYISYLTGITFKMMSEAPKLPDVLGRFVDFVADDIVVGHNITFDISFINRNKQLCFDTGFDNDYIDTLKLSRMFLPKLKSHKLGIIAQHLNFDTDGMHRGLKDCIVTNMCYQKFLQMHKEKQLKQTNALGLNLSEEKEINTIPR